MRKLLTNNIKYIPAWLIEFISCLVVGLCLMPVVITARIMAEVAPKSYVTYVNLWADACGYLVQLYKDYVPVEEKEILCDETATAQ